MKVKIGKYKTWFNTRELNEFMMKKLKFSEKWADRITDPLQTLLNNTINKRNMDQPVKVKIDPYDVWNMAETLALVIHPMLVELKRQKCGAPVTDYKDTPKELWPEEGFDSEGCDTDENYFKRWEWILDEMIWAFAQLNINWEDQFHSGNLDIEWKKLENGNSEMIKGPNYTHVWDKEKHYKYQDRIQNGLNLFGKYYMGLWD